MSILRQDSATELSLVDRLADTLRPGRSIANLAETAERLELLVDTTRATVLADIEKLAALEALSPRGKHWICVSPWPYTDGFYLAATAARLEQVLDSVQAFASLHRIGAHRAAWAVLEQAATTLTRLWMLTEVTVFDQPWDEARRSGRRWVQFAESTADIAGVTALTPHLFDIVYTDEDAEDEEVSLDEAASAATRHAKQVVDAIGLGSALALVNVPAHLQLGPEALTSMPSAGTGVDSAELVTAQTELAVELVRSAATSTRLALEVSQETRDA